ncbi:YciI family protein [Rhodanobacter sp. FW102-FHT14D06]|uniref:YciI family protein n=2 Tax=unclassified Rhodanobacter TaxID=2621553 RepID=A0AB74UNT4_9GAMM
MPTNEYLLISRGQWDEDADKDAVQDTIDRFYAWYEQGLAQGRLKPGSRLANRGKLVSREAVTDGPFSESKELVGGYWFIVADTLEEAASIAAENPCLAFGLTVEVRPLESVRSSVEIVTNETPRRWKTTDA